MSEHLYFELDEAVSATRTTKVVRVVATRDGAPLGAIRWFGRWRQYAFFPEPGTVFSPGCLQAITSRLDTLTAAQRRRA